jgi:hypothetical protein
VSELPHPTIDAVNRYLDLWDSLENYVLQEQSLDKLFFETYPYNTDIRDILVKASTLNDFYSTNIFSIFPVAKHIHALNIDERLHAGDDSLVNEIALVDMGGGTKRNFYSFATKYCSHHFPLLYPIYDSYVEKVLMAYKKQDRFAKFTKGDLKDYPTFKAVVINFSDYYGLNEFNLKDIDRYLWQQGKDYFPIKY